MKNIFNLSTFEMIEWLLANRSNECGIVVCDSDEMNTIEAINKITSKYINEKKYNWNINVTECAGSILIY